MNIRRAFAATVIGLAAFGASAANASIFLTNTGYDATGTEIPLSTVGIDGNWLLSGTGTGILPGGSTFTSVVNGIFPQGPWVADDATSRWITPTRNAADSFDPAANGEYDFTQTFTLASASASFAGQFASDNIVTAILLNGAPIYTNALGNSDFASWTAFGASSGFVAGVNTLTFVNVNYAQNGGNPAGLDVQFLSQAVAGVPEPATWTMLILGFGAVGFVLRRKSLAFA